MQRGFVSPVGISCGEARKIVSITLSNLIPEKSFGITEEDYEVILEQQRGVCAICGDGPNAHWVRSQKNKVLAVDHDHKTGKIRGLLCAKCNAGLGAFLDNPKLLRKAVKYLKGRMGESNGKEERK